MSYYRNFSPNYFNSQLLRDIIINKHKKRENKKFIKNIPIKKLNIGNIKNMRKPSDASLYPRVFGPLTLGVAFL
jgi:hypothetical protein